MILFCYFISVFDNYQVKVTVGEDTYTIALFDTAGKLFTLITKLIN